jgi:uncharacterized phiE125 gp8 family phage protein
MSTWRRTLEPAGDPFDLAAAKLWLVLPPDTVIRDDVLQALIPATVRIVERMSNRALLNQTWERYYDLPEMCDHQGHPIIFPPVQPLISVSEIGSIDLFGNETAQTISAFRVVAGSPGFVMPLGISGWPSQCAPVAGLRVKWVAGYGADDTTAKTNAEYAALKTIALHLLAFMYRNPGTEIIESAAGVIAKDVLPTQLEHLLAPLRWIAR